MDRRGGSAARLGIDGRWVALTAIALAGDAPFHSGYWLACAAPPPALALIVAATASLLAVATSPVGPPGKVVFHSVCSRPIRKDEARPAPCLQCVAHRVVFSEPLKVQSVAGIPVSREASDGGASQRPCERAYASCSRLWRDLPVAQLDLPAEPAVQARVVPCGVVVVRRAGKDVSVRPVEALRLRAVGLPTAHDGESVQCPRQRQPPPRCEMHGSEVVVAGPARMTAELVEFPRQVGVGAPVSLDRVEDRHTVPRNCGRPAE